eukprot:308961-Rhodomonas_salina.1
MVQKQNKTKQNRGQGTPGRGRGPSAILLLAEKWREVVVPSVYSTTRGQLDKGLSGLCTDTQTVAHRKRQRHTHNVQDDLRLSKTPSGGGTVARGTTSDGTRAGGIEL